MNYSESNIWKAGIGNSLRVLFVDNQRCKFLFEAKKVVRWNLSNSFFGQSPNLHDHIFELIA